MAIESLSNIMLYKSLMDDIHQAKKSVSTAQKQISSGRAIENYVDLTKTGRIEGAIDLESKLSNLDSNIRRNQVLEERIQAMDISLQAIADKLMDFRAVLVKRRSGIGNLTEFKRTLHDIGKATLGDIRDNLNLKFEGQYLFAGARIDQEPVLDIVMQSNYINGTYTSNYYRGDAIVRTSRVSDSLVVSYGVKADDECFQKAIGAINLAIDAANDVDLTRAYELLDEGIKDLINVRNNVANAMTQVAGASEIQSSMKLYFEVTLADLTATNIEEVAIKLYQDMTILTGTYQTFAYVSKLNLTDYL